MNNHLQPTKIIASLQLLTAGEFKSFHKWLQSPWCNTNKKLVEFYLLLQRHYPVFNSKNLTKQILFEKLYPDKNYDDKWMRNIMAAMCKQVEKFLVHQRLERDDEVGKYFLSNEYKMRHRIDWFEKTSGELVKSIEGKKVKESEDYLILALLHDEIYHQSKAVKTGHSGNSLLQISELYLDTFYSVLKWRHLSELQERNMILSDELEVEDKIERLLFFTRGLDIPIVGIYKDKVKYGKDLSLENYFELKKGYFEYFDRLPVWDRKLMIFYLINIAIRFWMRGNVEILNELFQLYKFGIEKQLLFHHGRLTEATYVNIVTTCNSIGDFEFCDEFVKKYSIYLPPENKENAEIWATAHLNYKQKKYSKSIELLSAIRLGEDVFVRSGKVLLLQSYFDACLIDRTYYLFFKDYCEAFKKYFQRNKVLSKERNKAYVNFSIYASQIMKHLIEYGASNEGANKLIDKLNNENNIQGKKWLLSKIEYIIGGLPQGQPAR